MKSIEITPNFGLSLPFPTPRVPIDAWYHTPTNSDFGSTLSCPSSQKDFRQNAPTPRLIQWTQLLAYPSFPTYPSISRRQELHSPLARGPIELMSNLVKIWFYPPHWLAPPYLLYDVWCHTTNHGTYRTLVILVPPFLPPYPVNFH